MKLTSYNTWSWLECPAVKLGGYLNDQNMVNNLDLMSIQIKRAVKQQHVLLNHYISIKMKMSVTSCITYRCCNTWTIIFPWQDPNTTLATLLWIHWTTKFRALFMELPRATQLWLHCNTRTRLVKSTDVPCTALCNSELSQVEKLWAARTYTKYPANSKHCCLQQNLNETLFKSHSCSWWTVGSIIAIFLYWFI